MQLRRCLRSQTTFVEWACHVADDLFGDGLDG
jgi:hypothetical protein